jgi:RNA polymerase sigma-70 factor (ECF subfamily)
VYLNAQRTMPADSRTSPDWDYVYSQNADALLRFARRLTKSTDEAADIVQEAFLRAIRSASPPDEDHQLTSWLYRIVANLIIDRWRRRRLLMVPLDKVRGSVEPTAPDRSDLVLVRQALQSIPPDQAVALVLRLTEGRSRAEIAATLAISEEGVKSRLARGRLNFAAAYRRLERGLAR